MDRCFAQTDSRYEEGNVKLRIVVFFILGFLAVKEVVAAPATEKSIRDLMALTGAENLGAQIIQNLLPV